MSKSVLHSLMSGASLLAVAYAPEGKNTLTMSDVAPYTDAFKAKYGRNTTLSLDDIEQIIERAEGDMSADDFAEAFKEAEPEIDDADYPNGKADDRSAAPAYVQDTKPGSAWDFAQRMDKQFSDDLETSAKAALENKRGAAVIMLDLFRLYGKDTVENVFPVPGSKKWEQNDNQPFDKYKVPKTLEEGSTAERSWYSDFIEASPRGKDLFAQRESIKKSGTEGAKAEVMPEHQHLIGDKRKRVAARAAIDGKINNFKAAIVRAVNLAKRLAFVNQSTGMEAILMTEDDGKPVESTKLVYIEDKSNKTVSDVITIGQFLALKVAEGATYSAIVGTTQRAPRTPEATVEVKVETLPQFDAVVTEVHTFIDKINEAIGKKDMKAYNALLTHLNGAGSDDILLSMNAVMNFFEGMLSKPGISKRLADLLADDAKKSKAA